MSETIEHDPPANEPSATETPAPAADAPDTEATETTDPPAEPPKPAPRDPRDETIRRQAYENREAKRQLNEIRAQLERLHPPDPNAPPDQAAFNRAVEQAVQVRETQAKDQTVIDAGNAAFPDFRERCNAVAAMGAVDNPTFMATIWKLPDAPKVVMALSDDPAETARLLSLPPIELSLALATMAHGIATAPPPPARATTKAPAPVQPLETTARVERNPDRMAPAEFREWWHKQTRSAPR